MGGGGEKRRMRKKKQRGLMIRGMGLLEQNRALSEGGELLFYLEKQGREGEGREERCESEGSWRDKKREEVFLIGGSKLSGSLSPP